MLDEAQKIKNADSEVSRVCKRLRATRHWALTCTPLENSPDDLVSLLEVLDPAVGSGLLHVVAHSGLRGQLARVQLRRCKADVLDDLPEKLVRFSPPQCNPDLPTPPATPTEPPPA